MSNGSVAQTWKAVQSISTMEHREVQKEVLWIGENSQEAEGQAGDDPLASS